MTLISSTLKAVASKDLDEEVQLEIEAPDKSIASILENNDGTSEGDNRGTVSRDDNKGGEASGS